MNMKYSASNEAVDRATQKMKGFKPVHELTVDGTTVKFRNRPWSTLQRFLRTRAVYLSPAPELSAELATIVRISRNDGGCCYTSIGDYEVSTARGDTYAVRIVK